MAALTLAAPAKINWSLDIVGQRSDGYHLLHSLMHSVSLYDRVTLAASDVDESSCTLPLGGDDIALKAWLLLKRELSLPYSLRISIEKHIPLGAGLAGGSTDAAAVLLGAVQLFDLPLSREQLCDYGLRLGADLPFCLTGGLADVQGIGERVQRIDCCPRYHLLLVNPGFAVSTPQMYQRYDQLPAPPPPDMAGLREAVLFNDRAALAACAGNALETPALADYPQLAQLKRELAALGRPLLMSGSGATLWLLAQDADEAQRLEQELSLRYHWVKAVHTLDEAWPEV